MPEAYRSVDAQYEQGMADNDRIDAVIEAAIDDLNSALNSVTYRNRSFCIREAILKLQELEGK